MTEPTLQGEEAAASGARDGVGAGFGAELVEQRADVKLRRVRAHAELRRDGAVRAAGRDELEHAAFARRERERLGRGRAWGGPSRERLLVEDVQARGDGDGCGRHLLA